jgi:hypothetical protein
VNGEYLDVLQVIALLTMYTDRQFAIKYKIVDVFNPWSLRQVVKTPRAEDRKLSTQEKGAKQERMLWTSANGS